MQMRNLYDYEVIDLVEEEHITDPIKLEDAYGLNKKKKNSYSMVYQRFVNVLQLFTVNIDIKLRENVIEYEH